VPALPSRVSTSTVTPPRPPATTLRDAGTTAISLRADVTDADSVRAAVDRTVTELGGLHVALNSAGIGHETPAEDLDPADW
jgi:NAD(P)-dependent dehydrogenase (short-subunit alcohol dehydrogenase family)